MSSGFNLAEKQRPTRVVFAAGGDADMEDEGLNPPLVRERWTDQTNIYLNADNSNQVNSAANTSQWNIGSDNSNGTRNNNFYADRLKKFSLTYLQIASYAPCINPRNNEIIFEINDALGFSQTFRAIIPPNNYTRLTTDYNNVPYVSATNATYAVSGPTWAPLISEWNGDPSDGIIDHILTAMNTAINTFTGVPYDPTTYGQFTALFSNGYVNQSGALNSRRYKNNLTGENLLTGHALYGQILNGTRPFRMIGGNTFIRGIHAWGCKTLPKDVLNPLINPQKAAYEFGPVQFQYSRWFDVVMPELMQFSKLANAGTGVPMGLLARIYTSNKQEVGLFDVVLDGYRQQQVNIRKDYTLKYLSLELRDEYGELYEIPATPSFKWPNSQGINMSLLAQL